MSSHSYRAINYTKLLETDKFGTDGVRFLLVVIENSANLSLLCAGSQYWNARQISYWIHLSDCHTAATLPLSFII